MVFERRVLAVVVAAVVLVMTSGAPAMAQSSMDPASSSATASSVQSTGPTQAVSGAAPAAGVAAPDATYNYRLGAGDVLRVIVFGEENLSGPFTVAGNGVLSFPLVGDLPASGKTVDEVRNEIADALRNGYIKDPKVSAEVLTFRPYFILGEVAKPGEYPYSDRITVMNAIATAGGFTYRANQKFVFIKPSDGSSEHKVRLNDQLLLAPGDTVRVAERYF
jgi:protein involved in polysaccharide export with SLBB domain